MSLSIIEIKAVPQYSLIAPSLNEAQVLTQNLFGDLLNYVYATVGAERAALELVYHKCKDSKVRILVTVRCVDNNIDVSADMLADRIVKYLANVNYNAVILADIEFQTVVQNLRTAISGRLVALSKSEKILSSSVSYSGYYYYTDILATEQRKNALSNFNELIQQLSLCDEATVSFQLIPSQLSSGEYYAMSSLSGELATTAQGVFVGNQMIREAGTDAPRKAYAYYSERVSYPMFTGSIIVKANQKDTDALVSAINRCIGNSVDCPVSFTAYEVFSNRMLAYDYFKFPWNLQNELLMRYREPSIWNGTVFQPTNLTRLPYLYDVHEATVFFRCPIDDEKITGLRVNHAKNDNEDIDESVFADTNIKFGYLLNSLDAVIGARISNFTHHALVVGAPGNGKTTFALNMLLQFYEKGIPFLAIEPTKTEYRTLVGCIPDLQIFTPGNTATVPFIINPFIPPKGIRLEQYTPSLMSAFRVMFSMETPLEEIFQQAIRQTYSLHGWKNSSTVDDPGTQKFGLYEFILVFKRIVSSSAYKTETRANIETGGTFRLLNLIEQNKYIYDTVNTIPINELLSKPTVIELNAIADSEQKALVMALLLIQIFLYTQRKGSNEGNLENIVMIDEAHVLFDNAGQRDGANKAQQATSKSLQKMIAEIRAYGTGIIIADQLPSKVTEDIVSDTEIKVMFRLVAEKERTLIAGSTNMNEYQAQYLARLKKGEAAVYFADLNSPKLIMTQDVRKVKGMRYSIDDKEIHEKSTFWNKNRNLLVPYYECAYCEQCSHSGCQQAIREEADYYASKIIAMLGNHIKTKELLVKYSTCLHDLIIKYEAAGNRSPQIKKLCNCAKIQFLRQALLSASFYLSRDDISLLLRTALIKEGKKNV